MVNPMKATLAHPNTTQPRPVARENFSILFLGFTREAAAAIQSALQAARIAPRCRIIRHERELLGSLTERSWDLLLLSEMQQVELTFEKAAQRLQELNKDIPLLLLCDTLPDTDRHLTLLNAGITVAITGNHEKLKVVYILQSLAALKQRKEWRQSEAHLEQAQHRINELIQDSKTAICFVKDNRVCSANPAFANLLGYQDVSALAQLHLERLVTPSCKDQLIQTLVQLKQGEKALLFQEAALTRADGSRLMANLHLTPVRLNGDAAIQVDVALHLTEADIFADIDPITGLLNQSGFHKYLDQQLGLARRGGHDGFLFYLQLDHYDFLLERHGQESIDLWVQQLTPVLKGLLNQSDSLGRIDDQHFCFLLAPAEQDTAKALAREICIAIAKAQPLIHGFHLQSSCSIGITSMNESTPRGTELLSRAKQALANLPAGNDFSFFQPSQSRAVVTNDSQAVQRVLDAIINNHFKLLFQPIVPLDTEIKYANYEILLRLLTEDEEISPSIFMSSISDDNVLARMDLWVLEECVMLMRQALDQGKRQRLFINITGRTLRNKALLPWFAEQLRSLGLTAEHFVFQISEVDALGSPAYYKAFCQALHQLHCRICLKHYGASSESTFVLSQAKVDFIKLDASYLKELNQNRLTTQQMVEIIQPLKENGLEIIAPMIEDTAQMRQLFIMGINMVQGHYIQPPQPEMHYDFFNQ